MVVYHLGVMAAPVQFRAARPTKTSRIIPMFWI